MYAAKPTPASILEPSPASLAVSSATGARRAAAQPAAPTIPDWMTPLNNDPLPTTFRLPTAPASSGACRDAGSRQRPPQLNQPQGAPQAARALWGSSGGSSWLLPGPDPHAVAPLAGTALGAPSAPKSAPGSPPRAPSSPLVRSPTPKGTKSPRSSAPAPRRRAEPSGSYPWTQLLDLRVTVSRVQFDERRRRVFVLRVQQLGRCWDLYKRESKLYAALETLTPRHSPLALSLPRRRVTFCYGAELQHLRVELQTYLDALLAQDEVLEGAELQHFLWAPLSATLESVPEASQLKCAAPAPGDGAPEPEPSPPITPEGSPRPEHCPPLPFPSPQPVRSED